MQKELKDLFRTIWRNSNLIGITNEDLEVFASKDTTTIIADFQTEQNSQGTFQSLCHNVQEKLGQQARKGYVENILIYIDMPKGEQGLTMQDLETLNGMQQAIAPNACQILAIGTHTAGFLRIAVVIGMNKMKTSPTFFSCKGKKIFAFSDTHGLHRQLEIPQSASTPFVISATSSFVNSVFILPGRLLPKSIMIRACAVATSVIQPPT